MFFYQYFQDQESASYLLCVWDSTSCCVWDSTSSYVLDTTSCCVWNTTNCAHAKLQVHGNNKTPLQMPLCEGEYEYLLIFPSTYVQTDLPHDTHITLFTTTYSQGPTSHPNHLFPGTNFPSFDYYDYHKFLLKRNCQIRLQLNLAPWKILPLVKSWQVIADETCQFTQNPIVKSW